MDREEELWADGATILVYIIIAYYDVLVWPLTGVHLAIRYTTGTVNSACVSTAILQLSSACLARRALLPPFMAYGVCIFGMLLCALSRSDLFRYQTHETRGATVILFYTLAFYMNRQKKTDLYLDITRVILFVLVCHCTNRTKRTVSWDKEARTAWVLTCEVHALLAFALLQLVVDSGVHESEDSTPPTHPVFKQDIETWDVVDNRV